MVVIVAVVEVVCGGGGGGVFSVYKVKTSRCVRVIAERTTAAVSELRLTGTPRAELW